MKGSPISFDDRGREAFAYLAVMLMVLSGLFISYQVYLDRRNDREEIEVARLVRIGSYLSEDMETFRSGIIGLHDSLLRDCEEELVKGEINTTIDGELQTRLYGSLWREIEEQIEGSRCNREGLEMVIDNISIEIYPVTVNLDAPVPSASVENSSGLLDRTVKPSVIGVNSSLHIEVTVRDSSRTLLVKDDLDMNREVLTLLPLLQGRMERFRMGVECTELSELMNYMLGSLAQMKCLMGYGREAYGEDMLTPLLTHREIMTCMDLAVSLMAADHLHGTDELFLNNVTRDLGSVHNTRGLDMADVFETYKGEIDPSMLVILGEGLFSDENPPEFEMIVRPLLTSLVDGLLLRMIDFIGMGDSFYSLLGSISYAFELGKDIVNSLSTTILGRELLETNERSAEEILEEVISSSNLFENDEACLMNRIAPGIHWEGEPVDNYPMIELPNLTRTLDLYLNDGNPASEMYLGKDGRVHSRVEYYDKDEEFLGWNSTHHRVDVEFNFQDIEPLFRNVSLDDKDLISDLALYLGTIASDDSSAEQIMMEKGRIAIRKGIDNALDLISVPGKPIWDNQWKGWNRLDPPDLYETRLPLSRMISLEIDPLTTISDIFSTSILDQLDISGFLSFLEDTGSSYSTAVASFIHDRYDTIVGREDQIGHCLDNTSELMSSSLFWYMKDQEMVEDGVIVREGSFGTEDPYKVDIIFEERRIPTDLCLGIEENGIKDIELDLAWRQKVEDSFHEVFKREMGRGINGHEPGYIWSAFSEGSTRSSSSIISADLDPGSLSDSISEMMTEALVGIEGAFYMPINTTSGRMLCSLPEEKDLFIPKGQDTGNIDIDLTIVRLPASSGDLRPSDGTYYTDPLDNPIPYSTGYDLQIHGKYVLEYSGRIDNVHSNKTIKKAIDVALDIKLEVASMWPMSGVTYQQKGSLIERLKDQAKEALNIITRDLETIGNRVLGDTMSSLRDVPPLVMDLVEGKELDLAEISRVISNITMDASTTIREGVKGAINELVDMGVSGLIDWLCTLIGIDSINISFDLGAFDIRLYSERDALQGDDGEILTLDIGFDPIGMSSHLSFSRVENGTLDFNGTLIFDIGPLYIRAEMDPFMMRAPHMISIEGSYRTGEEPIRFSLKCPTLEEYRSCEISLGSSLGVEPFVPIPILGINAVIDAGFRLRYRMPAEMTPHLNEVMFMGSLEKVEVYNPRLWPLYGSTIVIENMNGDARISWRIEDTGNSHTIIDIGSMDIWREEGVLDMDSAVRVLLNDPSGELMDDVVVEGVRNGWYSRDADGYGVWRWGDGSPGSSNSLSVPGDIKTILISIAISSLKEAWEISYEEYGLTFDIVVPFLQLALDLFMERFLAVVRELVMDVMMFLDVMITDSSGTAGSGLELFFSADGEAVADFFQWLYDNLKVFIAKMADPSGAGDYTSFPWEILHRCRVGIMVFSEVEMPIPIADLAPPGVNLPDSFRLAVQGSVSISFPMKLLGMDVDGFSISLGVFVMEAPAEIVSLFYEVSSTSMTTNLWLLRVEIWQGD